MGESVLELRPFAVDGVLANAAIADFLRAHKVVPGVVIRFEGVQEVTLDFLDRLLGGLEDLDAVLAGLDAATMSLAVAEVVGVWRGLRQGVSQAQAIPVDTGSVAFERRAPAASAARSVTAPHGGAYTPTRLYTRLRTALRAYIESAYPLKHPALIRARRALLDEGEAGRLLAASPFVETTPRYPTAEGTIGTFALPEPMGAFFAAAAARGLVREQVYGHQRRALEAFLGEGRDIIVATGTGSGKTECFTMPLMATLYSEAAVRPASFETRGVRALILYPMNALVNDQLARLRLQLGTEAMRALFHAAGGRHPTFGMYTSRTRYPGTRSGTKDGQRVAPLVQHYLSLPAELEEELRRRGRYPAKDLSAFFGAEQVVHTAYKSGAKVGQSRPVAHWERRLLTGPDDSELLTRHEMIHDPSRGQGSAPDVLVTNYSMLEYMLMRPFERPIFEETRAWLASEPEGSFLLIVDEAHMYRGAPGAEVAFLIRRLRARLGLIGDDDRFRVICTSASLGTDADALERVRTFAADLTGKAVERFEVVTSRREVVSEGAPGTAELAEALVAVDLAALHEAATGAALAEAVAPVLRLLGERTPEGGLASVRASLHRALSEVPAVHRVLAQTSSGARSLDALAELVFPEVESRLAATEVLLSLGALARRSDEEAGLIPTRLHLMFRGLEGLWACVNPSCAGMAPHADGGPPSPVGKLFHRPRPDCDVCGSRVFELLSCRQCGTAYLQAYVPAQQPLEQVSFLWSEATEALQSLEVLPDQLESELCEQARVERSTGFLMDALAPSHRGLRAIGLPWDPKKRCRQGQFTRCPECQSASHSETRRIGSFRTAGEQPFTALIEAQFIEQPPQPSRRSLPNEGRKVLIFSDGRQRAARLAPALETSHSRDAFRQVLALAAQALSKLGESPRISRLYPAVLWVCRERRVDLFPDADAELLGQLAQVEGQSLASVLNLADRGYLPARLPYARRLFAELCDRFYALWSLGLATVQENPLIFDASALPAGLPEGHRRVLLRHWLRAVLEDRSYMPPGFSRGKMADAFPEQPRGMQASEPRSVTPRRFGEYLEKIVPGSALREATREAFHALAFRRTGVTMALNHVHYLNDAALVLCLRPDEAWLRCQSCNRLSVDHIDHICPNCCGALEPVGAEPLLLDARSGFYRDKVLRALGGDPLEPFGLSAMEHSAQLAAVDDSDAYALTEQYELRFQDIPVRDVHDKVLPPIDVLSCTTTMEVGIDIGQLAAVALRNVPPHVANYQQRAGRAGRRGTSIASVLTWCQGGSHDAHYFAHPDAIISGEVRPPMVYVENTNILQRHVNAYLVQRFFHAAVEGDTARATLFESLGTVEPFLDPTQACSFAALERWLTTHEATLHAELHQWVPRYSHGRGESIVVDDVIDGCVPSLLSALRRDLPFELFGRPAEELTTAERDVLQLRLQENLLQTLLDHAILPRYAFPTDIVSLYVLKPDRKGWKQSNVPEFLFQPTRDLQLALTEYAPGREITIDKRRLTSAALYSPYVTSLATVFEEAPHYVGCAQCGYVEIHASKVLRASCPACRSPQMFAQRFVVPPGFAVDVNAEERRDEGGSVAWAGLATRAQLEPQSIDRWALELFDGRLQAVAEPHHLVVVNKGLQDRGFRACPDCGYTEPEVSRRFTRSALLDKAGNPAVHSHPTQLGRRCDGIATQPFFLGHRFRTDVLLLRLTFAEPFSCKISERAGQAALTTLAEALCLAASRVLKIEDGEIQAHWSAVRGEDGRQAQVYVYDRLAGGAGYARDMGAPEMLRRIWQATDALLDGCTCEASCYGCLRHYQNQRDHGLLDRKLALAVLRHVTTGELPSYTEAEQAAMFGPLCALLELQGWTWERDVAVESVRVPLIVTLPDGRRVWYEPHHPFVTFGQGTSKVLWAGELQMEIVAGLNGYDLRHNLPKVRADLDRWGGR